MNKKLVALIVAFIILIACIGGFLTFQQKKENANSHNSNQSQNKEIEKNNTEKKSLVVYFSTTGNTKKIAEYIKNTTDSDIVEIIPKDEYTSADLKYSNSDCRANKEQNDSKARPEIKNTINIEDYDTIYLGYPIWWGTIPKIILTLLDHYDLSNKTVIPFCTSGGSGISQSETDLKNYNSNIEWMSGKRFSSSAKESEVSDWIKELNLNSNSK